MGSQIWMCFWVCLFGLLSFIHSVNSEGEGTGGGSIEGLVRINGIKPIGKIDDDFVCATLDWWPPEKCDYGTCSWGSASLLNLVSYIYPFAINDLKTLLFFMVLVPQHNCIFCFLALMFYNKVS